MRQVARTISIAVLVWMTAVLPSSACQVPVFRYALERWMSDSYVISVVPGQSGTLSDAEQDAVDYLQSLQGNDEIAANIQVEIKDAPDDAPDTAQLVIHYPDLGYGRNPLPVWVGDATMENARKIVDSPARREIVKRLLQGESSIWLLVESGDAEKDKAAADSLNNSNKEAVDTLEIPEGVILHSETLKDDAPVNREDILQSKIPLKIDFSVLRVARDDPAEEILIGMLMHLEDDLGEFVSEPMAFPIFGRGRVLEPLVGKGVNRSTILEYAGYLCGACSCEVKDQNPGRDLIIAANWNAALEGNTIVDKILPPPETVLVNAAGSDTSGDSSLPFPRWAILLAGVLVVVAAGVLFSGRGSRGDSGD